MGAFGSKSTIHLPTTLKDNTPSSKPSSPAPPRQSSQTVTAPAYKPKPNHGVARAGPVGRGVEQLVRRHGLRRAVFIACQVAVMELAWLVDELGELVTVEVVIDVEDVGLRAVRRRAGSWKGATNLGKGSDGVVECRAGDGGVGACSTGWKGLDRVGSC